MSLWNFHQNPSIGFEGAGDQVQWYPDAIGTVVEGQTEYDLDYVPVGSLFFLIKGQVPVFTGYTVNAAAKKLILDDPPTAEDEANGIRLDAFYNREV